MKVLIINGSPKMERSNSLKLTNAFVDGLCDTCDAEVETITVSKLNINTCLGCLNCWKRTPGECFCYKNDDMAAANEKIIAADVVIWSFPLYYYSLPGTLKVFMDRLCPLNKPVIMDRVDGVGCGTHPARYEKEPSQRHILISSCGHFNYKGNYNSVVAQWDLKYGAGRATTLFCGEGEMFPVPMHADKVERYLDNCRQAGRDWANYGTILFETRQKLDELIIPKDEFTALGNGYYAHMEKKAAQRAAAKAAESAKE